MVRDLPILNGTTSNLSDRLFKIVSNKLKESSSPQEVDFNNTEKRKPKKEQKLNKIRSEKDFEQNPYQLTNLKMVSYKTPSEIKHVQPFETALSEDSLRRKTFNQDVELPIDTSHI